MRYSVIPYPTVSRDAADILRLFGPEAEPAQRAAIAMLGARRNYLGCDLEFDEQENPSILGVSDGHLHVSVPYGEGIELFKELVKKHNPVFVGHSFISADFFVFRNAGIHLDLLDVQDTIIWHWLTGMHLCKTSQKSEDGDGEKRGRGYMNFWAFVSLWTSLPNHKEHRGENCAGPCPECDVYAYNGLDAYGPLLALSEVVKVARIRGIAKLYPMHRDLAYVLAEMQRYGIQGDMPYVETLRVELARDKERIAAQLPFSPTSPKQIIDYFKERDIDLEDTQEGTIREAIELGADDEFLELLLQFKELGNGPDRWFGPKFVDANGRVHPRLGFFTSSARLMCASPNFQNLTKRRVDRHTCVCGKKDTDHVDGTCEATLCVKFRPVNVGKKIRRAVVASPGTYLMKADYSNAENRNFLHLAGVRVERSRDLHTWVMQQANITEDLEFSIRLGGAREAAKSVQHACLTGDHEVLTPQGWVPISTCSENVTIAQWDVNGGVVSFVRPIAFHKYPVVGELTSLQGRSLQTLATSNHTWPVNISGAWNGRKYSKTQRKTVDKFSCGRIHTSGLLIDPEREVLTDLEIQQAVAVQADGCLRPKGEVSFHVVKERKKERLTELFGVKGKPCGCHERGEEFYISRSMKYRLLDSDKSFNANVLLMSERQRRLFLGELLLWDGSIRAAASIQYRYDNSDYKSLVWVQTIAHLTNSQALLRVDSSKSGYKSTKKMWRLSFNRRQFAATDRLEKSTKHFEGDVYCFTVPSGYFLVRYKDTIHVTGNSNYLEGLQLKTEAELRSERMRQEIKVGARLVYPKWNFEGRIVTFTGANLAQRAFGSKTWENRKKALDITERYFSAFPAVRLLQQDICRRMEKEKAVITPLGYYTLALGDAEERMKTACAIWGSQPVAHLTKLSLIDLHAQFRGGRPMRPILQVHDEELCEVSQEIPPREAFGWLQGSMEIEMPDIPEMVIPIDAAFSPFEDVNGCKLVSNWRDMQSIKA